MDAFDNDKKQHIDKLMRTDKSRKGSMDEAIADLVNEINAHEDFYTTSSCSGRIIAIAIPKSEKKNEAEWVFASHKEVDFDDVYGQINEKLSSNGKAGSELVYFRFEPLILHLAARSVDSAMKITALAKDVGFKHSGIIAAKNRVIVEIDGIDRIDAPIAKDKKLIISEEYFRFLINEANKKLRRNKERACRFLSGFMGLQAKQI